jgi:glycosyltransferase involved in cell wall biosynthesis
VRVLVGAAYYEPAFEYGGPVTVVAEGCRALVRAGASVTVFTTTANGATELDVPVGQPIERDGVETWYFPRRPPRGYFHSPAMAAELRRRAGQFDILHLHGLWCHANLAGRRAAQAARVPYVATLHGGLDPTMMRKGWLKKRLYWLLCERRNLSSADALVALTEDERRQIEALRVGTPVAVIPHGLDAAQYGDPPSRDRLRDIDPALADSPYVLFLGRLDPKKGVELLLSAFGRCSGQAPDLRLVVAGAGEPPYEAMLKAAARQAAEGRVIFPGHVSGEVKRALLAHAVAFCLPSKSEGLPTACLEAMLSQTPVVISRECYLPEVAVEGAGFVVERTPEAIAQAVLQLARNPRLREETAARARAYAARAFDSRLIAGRMLALYEEVIRRARAGGERRR